MRRWFILGAVVLCTRVVLAQTDTPTETPTPTPTSTPTVCGGVNRYWVGDGGNWTDTAHWSCTSGGVGGAPIPACVPLHSVNQGTNNVIFDANSFTLDAQVIVDDTGSGECTLNFDCSTVSHVPTITLPVYVTGDFTLSAAMTVDASNETNFTATSGTHTVTTAGQTLGAIDFYGTATAGDAGTWNLADDLAGTQVLLSYGTLNTNNHQVTASIIQNNNTDSSADFTLNMGSSLFLIVPGMTTTWDMSQNDPITITVNAGTSTIRYASIASTGHFAGSTHTYHNVEIVMQDGSSFEWTGTSTVDSLSISIDEQDANGAAGFTIMDQGTTTVNHFSASGTATTPLNFGSGSDLAVLNCQDSVCAGDWLNVTFNDCEGNTPCYAGSHGTVDANSINWLAEDPPIPTGTETPTQTMTPTATRTPTITRTPTAHSGQENTHVTALELTLGNQMARPRYAEECLNAAYTPKDEDMCRCVIYVKRLGGVDGLYFRCPNGIERAVTLVP